MMSQKVRIPLFCFFFFYSCTVFHYVNVLQLFIHSSTDGHLDCFQYLDLVYSAAMNIRVRKFFWIGVRYSQGLFPAVELPGQNTVPFLVFWGTSILFSTVAAPVCTPTNSAWGSPFLTASPALSVGWFTDDGHSDRCEVISHCAFNLQFLTLILGIFSSSVCMSFGHLCLSRSFPNYLFILPFSCMSFL